MQQPSTDLDKFYRKVLQNVLGVEGCCVGVKMYRLRVLLEN
jgi:hypothetical protein